MTLTCSYIYMWHMFLSNPTIHSSFNVSLLFYSLNKRSDAFRERQTTAHSSETCLKCSWQKDCALNSVHTSCQDPSEPGFLCLSVLWTVPVGFTSIST